MPGVRMSISAGGEAFDHRAAATIASALEGAATAVVATGRTPMGVYARLGADLPRGRLDGLRVFQLDEYVGVGPHDPRSLASWTRRSFVDPLGIDPSGVVWLDGLAEDLEASCSTYEDAVANAGGYDLAVLGIGPNGHLGFNEPPAGPSSRTRVVRLSEASLRSNAAYWPELEVPTSALTAGMDLLLAARRVVLLASGRAKRDIVHRAFEGPVTPDVPASFLQEHPDVEVVVDAGAWGG
ncbi:MAG TPA: glucosamine-6-phosphate deaminase [Actinomycetota bacterium]